jgi:hypothetical protein
VNRDDFDLEALRDALAPSPCEPPSSSISALHHAVNRHFSPKIRGPRWKARFVTFAAAGATVLFGSAGAYAFSGAVLPDPLRTALHGVGLPVDSVNVARVRSAESHLVAALDKQDLDAVSSDAQLLKKRASELSGADKTEVGAGIQRLLTRADHFEADQGGSGPLASSNDTGGDLDHDGSAEPGTGEKGGSTTESGEDGGGSGESTQVGSSPTTLPGSSSGGGGSGPFPAGANNSSSSEGGASSTTNTTLSGTATSGDGGGGGGGGSSSDGDSVTTTTAVPAQGGSTSSSGSGG